jgi:hypothetical protein
MLRVSEWPEQKFIIVVPQETLARGCLRNFILGLTLIGVSTLLSLIGVSTLLPLVGVSTLLSLIGVSTLLPLLGDSTLLSLIGVSTLLSLIGVSTLLSLIGDSILLSLVGDSTLLFDICPYGLGGSLMLACCSSASHHSRCLPWVSHMANDLPGSFKVALLFTTYLARYSAAITPNVEISEWSEVG